MRFIRGCLGLILHLECVKLTIIINVQMYRWPISFRVTSFSLARLLRAAIKWHANGRDRDVWLQLNHFECTRWKTSSVLGRRFFTLAFCLSTLRLWMVSPSQHAFLGPQNTLRLSMKNWSVVSRRKTPLGTHVNHVVKYWEFPGNPPPMCVQLYHAI